MKQITTSLFLSLIFTFFMTQAAFAAGNTNLSSTGLSDIVQADDAAEEKKDGEQKKGKKKQDGDDDDEPDCD